MTIKDATALPPIPRRVEDIDRAWFDAVLEAPVASAHIAEVIHGTATKVKVELVFAEAGAVPRLQTVWVKTGLEPHSKSIGTEKVYAGETFFYRNYGGQFETRTPTACSPTAMTRATASSCSTTCANTARNSPIRSIPARWT